MKLSDIKPEDTATFLSWLTKEKEYLHKIDPRAKRSIQAFEENALYAVVKRGITLTLRSGRQKTLRSFKALKSIWKNDMCTHSGLQFRRSDPDAAKINAGMLDSDSSEDALADPKAIEQELKDSVDSLREPGAVKVVLDYVQTHQIATQPIAMNAELNQKYASGIGKLFEAGVCDTQC